MLNCLPCNVNNIHKVKVTSKKCIQQLSPFQGKIVFTLQGDKSEFVTSFIPEVSIFCNGVAISLLVPNSLIENANTYYHYAIYAQGHKPGVFFSNPVEEGHCIIPEHDCDLDDIISNVPDKETAEEIITKASNILATIRSSLDQVQFYVEQANASASLSDDNKADIIQLVQKIEIIYDQLKDKEQFLQNTINSTFSSLSLFQNQTEQTINNLIAEHTAEFIQTAHTEQLLLQDLWQKVLEKFSTLENYQEFFTSIQLLQQQYAEELNNLIFFTNLIPQIQIDLSQVKADLLQKQDQMLEISNFEILNIMTNH